MTDLRKRLRRISVSVAAAQEVLQLPEGRGLRPAYLSADQELVDALHRALLKERHGTVPPNGMGDEYRQLEAILSTFHQAPEGFERLRQVARTALALPDEALSARASTFEHKGKVDLVQWLHALLDAQDLLHRRWPNEVPPVQVTTNPKARNRGGEVYGGVTLDLIWSLRTRLRAQGVQEVARLTQAQVWRNFRVWRDRRFASRNDLSNPASPTSA